MHRESAFFQRSRKVAEQFLQTAVVIDDRAFQDANECKPLVEMLALPPTPSTVEPRHQEAAPARPPAQTQEAVGPPQAHGLDPQPVIDGFARHGIVCSVLRRQPDDCLDKPTNRLSRLAAVADILVLDWNIHSGTVESAEETLNLLETAIRRNEEETPRQLRLIVIYTGEIDLLRIAERIRDHLQTKLGAVEIDGSFAFTKGAVRIVILGKKTVAGRSPEAKSQEADFDELAARTVSEFTTMTAGLVSNVALGALARLRRATHRILDRFSPRLDAAFLVHRALLETPQEADDHLVPIIAAELQAVIRDSGSPITTEVLADWLAERQMRVPTHTTWGFKDAEDEHKSLLRLCERGHKELVKGELLPQLEWLREITPQHGCAELDQLMEFIGGTDVAGANEELAMLMAVNSQYSDEPPQLTLGTLVLHEKEGQKSYWLCLQPRCDSVRLTRARGFPMLKLSQADDRFSVVVRVDNAFVRLRIDPRPFKIRTVEFKPDKAKQVVIAIADPSGQHWFESKDPPFRCRWIGELKFEQAQRAVQAFANQNSRVGLTESEWQRRWDLGRGDG